MCGCAGLTLRRAHDQNHAQVQGEVALWQSPILYFGRVVDESNRPIGDVRVTFSARAMNLAGEEIWNAGNVKTDPRGMFKIEGVNGVGLMLELSHPGYYPYPENPTSFDKRALPKKGYFSDTEEKAEVFRMHSKGYPGPLVHRADGMSPWTAIQGHSTSGVLISLRQLDNCISRLPEIHPNDMIGNPLTGTSKSPSRTAA